MQQIIQQQSMLLKCSLICELIVTNMVRIGVICTAESEMVFNGAFSVTHNLECPPQNAPE